MDWWRDVDEPFKIKHTLSTCRDKPFRATLLHSPGWNEGKARYGTLGTHRQKRIELLQERHFQRARLVCVAVGGVPLLKELKKMGINA